MSDERPPKRIYVNIGGEEWPVFMGCFVGFWVLLICGGILWGAKGRMGDVVDALWLAASR